MCIKIETSDGVVFSVPLKHIERCQTIKNLFEDVGTETVIPLPNVNSRCFRKIAEYLAAAPPSAAPTGAAGAPQETDGDASHGTRPQETKGDLPFADWEKKFVESMDQDELFELLLASNYLDLRPMMDALCAGAANLMNGKSVQGLRDMFAVENDFTPEEEKQNAEENKWVEEMAAAEEENAAK